MYCGELKVVTCPMDMDMILWEGYRHIAAIKITNNTMTACAHHLISVSAIEIN